VRVVHTVVVRTSAIRILLLVSLGAGCGLLEDDEPGNAAPVGGTADSGLPPAGGGSGTTGDMTGSGSSSGTTTGNAVDSTGSTGSTGADLGDVVVAGVISQGDGAWVAPLECELRLYGPNDIEPMSGSATGVAAAVPITIDEFPYAYSVTYDDVPGEISSGWEGYLGVRCDFDGDGQLDTVGAYYPELPAALITIPLDGLDMSLVFL